MQNIPGVHAGKVDLFANHKVILTPLPSSADWAVEKLIQLWQAAKAEVICMDVDKHDEVLGAYQSSSASDGIQLS